MTDPNPEGTKTYGSTTLICIFYFVVFLLGTMDFVLIWSCLNFFGIAAETLAREIGKTARYQKWEAGTVSDVLGVL